MSEPLKKTYRGFSVIGKGGVFDCDGGWLPVLTDDEEIASRYANDEGGKVVPVRITVEVDRYA